MLPNGRRTIARSLAMALGTVIAGSGPGVLAETARPTILGDWTLLPITYKSCVGHQDLRVRPGPAPGHYRGTATTYWRCPGRGSAVYRAVVTISVAGDRVTIGSAKPGWIVETLRYVRPRRMEGHAAHGKFHLIYVRPKAPPTS